MAGIRWVRLLFAIVLVTASLALSTTSTVSAIPCTRCQDYYSDDTYSQWVRTVCWDWCDDIWCDTGGDATEYHIWYYDGWCS